MNIYPLLIILLTSLSLSFPSESADQEKINKLHKEAIVVDSHSDFLYRSEADNSGLADDVEGAHTTISKMKQGGIDAQFFSIWVPPAYKDYGYARKTLEIIDRLYMEVDKNTENIEVAVSVADIYRIAKQGKIAALMGIEGGHSIENKLELLRNYYRLGVRYMTLTWANNTDWADSSGDKNVWGGLNDFGVDVVKEMNKLGMMIDISHVSDETFWDVISISQAPIIASHSSTRQLNDHLRNMSDKMIKALAKNGGVIQINFYPAFIDQQFKKAVDSEFEKAHKEWSTLGAKYLDNPIGLIHAEWDFFRKIEAKVKWPPLSAVVDHIDHVVQLVGPNHVGIGSDFDGITSMPIGMEHQGKMPELTKLLVERGYNKTDIEKILGGNLLRVMSKVESLASK